MCGGKQNKQRTLRTLQTVPPTSRARTHAREEFDYIGGMVWMVRRSVPAEKPSLASNANFFPKILQANSELRVPALGKNCSLLRNLQSGSVQETFR